MKNLKLSFVVFTLVLFTHTSAIASKRKPPVAPEAFTQQTESTSSVFITTIYNN